MLIEGLPVLAMLLAFAIGFLAVGYLMFARAWVHSEAERALYCLAERRSAHACRREIRARVHEALPFGALEISNLRSEADSWTVEIKWKWNQAEFQVAKRLRIKDILANKGLRW